VSSLASFLDSELTSYQYHIETIQLPTAEELSATIERAHAAFPSYKKTTFAQRRRLMRTLKAWFLENMEDIVRVGVRDTGKTGSFGLTACTRIIFADRHTRFAEVDAAFGEVLTTCSKIDYLLKHGEAALAPEARPTNLLLAHKVSKVSIVWPTPKGSR
jgi:acyl-CoA reductase-like NAD-dependent aldehyde dehydrogenase